MVDERYNRPRDAYDGRRDSQDYGRDYGSNRYGSYSGAGYSGGRDDRGGWDDGRSYGSRDYGHDRYRQREQMQSGWGNDRQDGDRYGRDAGYDRGGNGDRWSSQDRSGGYGNYGYGSDNRRDRMSGYGNDRGGRDYGRQPQGYQYEDRGFMARAGDEVRSWFGDEEAERRREADARMDERAYNDRDGDYHHWRRGQMDALDRDYHEYREENRSRFANEFSTWRTNRQGQRDSLTKVKDHMEVVGSDGQHVGTVDKTRDDRIILTKNDSDAGGRHHSIPSSWIQTVDDKVTLSKSADDAKKAWRDEENRSAFGYGDQNKASTATNANAATNQSTASAATTSGTTGEQTGLNRSFSGTY